MSTDVDKILQFQTKMKPKKGIRKIIYDIKLEKTGKEVERIST